MFNFLISIDADKAGVPKGVEADNATLLQVMNSVYFWAGTIAVIVIVWAGFLYIISNGDSSRITQAKNALMSGVIGFVVVLMAFFITQFVLGRIA